MEPTVIETLKNNCECRPITHIKTLLNLFQFRQEIGDLLPPIPVMNFRVIGRIYDITIRCIQVSTLLLRVYPRYGVADFASTILLARIEAPRLIRVIL